GLSGLPAGNYVVWGTATVVGDEESLGMTCLIRVNDNPSNFIIPVGDTAIYSGKDDAFGANAMVTTLTLPSPGPGSIKVFCGSEDPHAEAQGEIVAVKLDALN